MIYNEDEKKDDKKPIGDKDIVLKTRKLLLFSEINKSSANEIISNLIMLDNDNSIKPIWIYINSPGGEVDSGFAIYDMIKFVKSPVYVLGVGLIASAASLIYCAVPRNRRFALPNSTYLIHQPLAKMSGVAKDVEIYAQKLDKIKALINKIIATSCNQSIERVTEDTDRDCYMDALEACQYGLVGKIVRSCDEVPII